MIRVFSSDSLAALHTIIIFFIFVIYIFYNRKPQMKNIFAPNGLRMSRLADLAGYLLPTIVLDLWMCKIPTKTLSRRPSRLQRIDNMKGLLPSICIRA
jgi:hypothetical protein